MSKINAVPIQEPRKVEGTMSARERAIAILEGRSNPQQNQTPVPNPSSVSPEEMGALRTTKAPEETEQTTNSESAAPAAESSPAETPASEAPKAEASEGETKKTPPQQPLSSQFAQLARKEKALRAQAQEIKAREEAIKAREDALKAPDSRTTDGQYVPKSKLLEDPLSVLNELGVTYDQITQRMLNAPSPEQQETARVINELRAEIKALKDASEGTKKSFETAQQQQYQQAISQIRSEVNQLVGSNEEFEMVKATGSEKDVVDLIERTFHKDGYLMSVEDAVKEVENYLVEEAEKLARTKKIQSRLAPKAATPTTTAEKKSPDAAAASKPSQKTLTNNITASRPLTARERAMMAFEGKLNK